MGRLSTLLPRPRPSLLLILSLWVIPLSVAGPQSQQPPSADGSCASGDQLMAAVTKLNDQLVQLQTQLTLQQTVITLLSAQVGAQGIMVRDWPPMCSGSRLARDCSDLPAGAQSGVHLLRLEADYQTPVEAFCDMERDGGGWTVIQRRADLLPRQDFFLGWHEYRRGFGRLSGEFWWGLEHLYQVTSLQGRQYQLHVYLQDFEGVERYALYENFRISSEKDGYRLHIANYSGNAGDSLVERHNGMRFSAKDRDQDESRRNCAELYKGAWWYNSCHSSNLNGLYLSGKHNQTSKGVEWYPFRGNKYSLKEVVMKIKPV